MGNRTLAWIDGGRAVDIEAFASAFSLIPSWNLDRADAASNRLDRDSSYSREGGLGIGRSDAGVALELSARAIAALEAAAPPGDASRSSRPESREESKESEKRGSANRELSAEEQDKVRELRARDAEVRAHENPHKAAAGRHARGGSRFEFEKGPDGHRYAGGGGGFDRHLAGGE